MFLGCNYSVAQFLLGNLCFLEWSGCSHPGAAVLLESPCAEALRLEARLGSQLSGSGTDLHTLHLFQIKSIFAVFDCLELMMTVKVRPAPEPAIYNMWQPFPV